MSEKTLGNSCTLKGGSGFPEKFQGQGTGDFPFAKVSDMELPGNHRFVRRANNYVNASLVNALNLNVFPAGTVVFAKVGAALLLNRRRILNQPTIIDNNMMGAIPNDVSSEYLYYFLQTVDFGFHVQPGVVPSINQSILSKITLPNLLVPQQNKIARILTTLDELIEKTEALIAKYQVIKQGLMHDLFTRGVDEHGHLRPSYEDAPDLYKESELGWIPMGWRATPLGEISSLQGGFAFRSADFESTGIQLIRIGNLFHSDLDLGRDPVFLPQHFARLQPDFVVRSGDILISLTGTFGKQDYGYAIQVPDDGNEYLLNQRVARFCLIEELVSSQYLLHVLHTSIFLGRLYRLPGGTKQANLSNSQVMSVHVPLPTMSEQDAIAKRFVSLDETLESELNTLQKIKLQKTGLMQDLLSGEVEVSMEEEEAIHA